MNPDLAPAGWRPRFVDYLYLGFTNATAFSPTDAMPLAPWAKIAMTVQSLISLALLGRHRASRRTADLSADMVGCALFLVSAHVALAQICGRRVRWTPRALDCGSRR